MPNFLYTARDQRGIIQAGRLDVLSEDEVVAQLQHRGLLVISVSHKEIETVVQGKVPRRAKKSRRMHGRVAIEDQLLFCQQLATLVEAGVPLLKGFQVVCLQVESRKLLLALEEVQRDIEAGLTFRNALAKHPAVFSSMWLNMVETGEASGHLAQSLYQVARHYESAEHLQNEAKTALTYPAFLSLAVVGVITFFVYWLVPKFTTMFTSMGIELPPLTRFVIGVSHFAQRYVVWIVLSVVGFFTLLRAYLRTHSGQWVRDRLLLSLPGFQTFSSCLNLAEFTRGLSTLLESGVPLLSTLIILAVAGFFTLLRAYLRTNPGQWVRDRLLLSLPGFQTFFSYLNLAEFTRGLSTLLESGVPLLSALTILEKSVTNKVFGQSIQQVREAVQEGQSMAEPMDRETVFPPMAVQMIQVGEEVGELSKMTDRIARYYEARVETFIARMTRLFEPIAIVVMGLIVLVIVLAIFMPIFKMATGIRST